MPTRTVPLITGEIYHVLNRGVNYQPIFKDRWDYKRALEIFSYYQFATPPIKFSLFDKLPKEDREKIWMGLKKEGQKLITPLSFCFMPNHFHFLLRQTRENGISKFLANLQNSLTRYINTRHGRTGHLLQGQFKSIRIETEEQLLHTSRYIHLNPYSSCLIKTVKDLTNYPWSSLSEFIEKKESPTCETSIILSNFDSKKQYLRFVLDQKDYQRTIDQIKHLLFE